jgi:methylaspartate ammonia-lyase
MAIEAAKRMEERSDKSESETLLMSFRTIAADCQSLAAQVMERSGIGMDGELANMTKDIRRTLALLRGADPSRQKKIGEKIIVRKESNEHIKH